MFIYVSYSRWSVLVDNEYYNEFYKTVSHDTEDPLFYLHTKAEGTLEYTTLFFIPKTAPFDLYQADYKPGVKLYVSRVFITDDDKELLPTYLRFLRGVIDSEDACPETAGDFCNGCPQPECSGCQSPVCPETGKPICQDDNSLCQVLPNTDVVCQSGVCSYSCQEGYLDCNGDGTGSDADGCEFQKETATSTCP